MNKKKKIEIGVTAVVAVSILSAGVVQGLAQNTPGTETPEMLVLETEETIKSAEQESNETGNGKKSETIYVIADAAGNAEEIIVEEWLRNTGGWDLLNDKSELTGIENVSGEETFSQDSEKIVWDANGKDIHYQGTSDKELPVSVQITYYLDGKEILPEELAGKNGKVKIRYDYTNREKRVVEISGNKTAIYVPFTVMSGMIFTDDCVKDVEVNSGKVITKDDKTVVVGVAFPGLQESLELEENEETELDMDFDIPDYVEVTFEAENFEMEMSASLIMNDLFSDLDLDSTDGRNELKDAVEELSDSSDELVDGSNDLADGIGELYDKLPDLTDGIQSLEDGIEEYTDGVASIDSGVGEIKSGSLQFVSGTAELSSGAGSLADGADTLADGAKTFVTGTKDMNRGVSDAKNGTEKLLSGYSGEDGAVTGAKSLADGAKQLDSGMDELVSGANTLIRGANTFASGIADINKGAVSLDKGMDSLQDGANSLETGTSQLSSSSASLVAGIENVSQALLQLQVKLEGDEEKQVAGQMEELKAALAQVSDVISSDQDGAYSIHNCYARISEDVDILYDFYCGNGSTQISQPQGEATNRGTGNVALNELKESAAASKTAADEAAKQAVAQGEQAAFAVGNAKDNLVTAKNFRETAKAEGATADGLYQNALNAYTPLLSNIKHTLNTIGLAQYAGYVDDGQGTAAAVAGGYQAAQGSYESATSNYESAAGEYEIAASGYQEVAESYQTAVEAYEKTIADYEAMIAQYEEMLAGQTTTLEAAEMTENIGGNVSEQQVQEAWTDLFMNLKILSVIENGDGTGQTPGLTASLNALEVSLFGNGEDNNGAFGELAGVINQLYAGVGSLETTDTNTILGGARALQSGSGQLMTGMTSLTDGIANLKTGTSELAEGTTQLSEGIASLTEGTGGFAQGIVNAKAGSSQLSDGAGQLSLGIEQLYSGTKELDGGMGALLSGAESLNSGAKSLASGSKELSKGGDTLVSGAGSLTSGAKELDNGVSALQSGVSELSSNSPKLIDGAAELSDGADELSDGVKELKDGANELKDGMEEFDEEGIKKLKQIFADDLDKLIDRLQTIQDAGNDYQSFAGMMDEMNGEVKFIIKTAGILIES